jgi:hypothetical protein
MKPRPMLLFGSSFTSVAQPVWGLKSHIHSLNLTSFLSTSSLARTIRNETLLQWLYSAQLLAEVRVFSQDESRVP